MIESTETVSTHYIYHFFKRLTDHACKYGWLYAEIVNLIGNAAIGIIGGK